MYRNVKKYSKNPYFLRGNLIHFENFRQNMFHHPKCFRTFLIEEIFIYFRVFCYDLEISESLENATPNATIRLQNVPLKKYAFIFNICPHFGTWFRNPLTM